MNTTGPGAERKGSLVGSWPACCSTTQWRSPSALAQLRVGGSHNALVPNLPALTTDHSTPNSASAPVPAVPSATGITPVPPSFFEHDWPYGSKAEGGRSSCLLSISSSSYSSSAQTVQIWLYKQLQIRIEGKIRGFDEFMNLVIDDAVEVKLATKMEGEKRRELAIAAASNIVSVATRIFLYFANMMTH
ncbi:hypothetical protein BDZ91DRAFT_783735 [Kalaharituber pfeilii]|nr:hypothetical protein BDZ91DRAFT_783735 [Kalaharituber pfeilii]